MLAFIALGLSWWRFAPGRSGAWEAAAKQIENKLPRVVLFHPSWQRDVLERMPQLPLVLLDGRQHLDLAGFGEVLFASESAQPESVLINAYTLEEWRDFAGKAVAVLKVPVHSLSVDFRKVRAFVEDPPGIAECPVKGEQRLCERQAVRVERREIMVGHAKTRCVWVEAPSGTEVSLRFDLGPLDELSKTALYLTRPDGSDPAAATVTLHADEASILTIENKADEPTGAWKQQMTDLRLGTQRIELGVVAERGVCVDLELMKRAP